MKILLFFLLFSFRAFCKVIPGENEIVFIKTYDRNNYIRIMFEMKNKPKYFIKQKENRIIVTLPNSIMYDNLHKDIDKLNIIEDIFLFREIDGLEFIIMLKDKAKLMRYLYTAPGNNTKYYRVIVDINKDNLNYIESSKNSLDDLMANIYNNGKEYNEKKFESFDDIISNIHSIDNSINNSNENKINLIDDFIKNKKIDTKSYLVSIDELIKNRIKVNTLNELLDLNNINEEEITKNFEEQNNDEIDLDDFINQISIDFKQDDKKIDNIKKENKLWFKKEDKFLVKNKFIVVLDAGHGGKDPGAMGKMKTYEKDINLLYAKFIKNELEKNKNVKVILTRSDDKFVSLSERVNIARRLNANLFISLHSDYNSNKKARGLSIYTLSKSASDERSTQLLKKQNGTFSYWKNKIKFDIIRYKNLNESVKFSTLLYKNMKSKNINMLGNKIVRQANFAVLLAPEFPSLLIELGFLSNESDEILLKTYDYKKKISDSIIKTLNSYFNL